MYAFDEMTRGRRDCRPFGSKRRGVLFFLSPGDLDLVFDDMEVDAANGRFI